MPPMGTWNTFDEVCTKSTVSNPHLSIKSINQRVWKGHLVRIAPNEVTFSDPSAVKVNNGQPHGVDTFGKATRTSTTSSLDLPSTYPNETGGENLGDGIDRLQSNFYDAWAAPNETGYPGHFPSRDEKLHTEHRRLVNKVYSMSSVLDSEVNIDFCTHLSAVDLTFWPPSSFAGADTTSIALTRTLYYLMRHPDPRRKLVAEIDADFADGQLSDPITYKEATTVLPYLKTCINEAMRLHPGVGFHLPRVTPPAGATMCSIYIPSGYRVGINPAAVQYDQGIFGPDADGFNPDHWLGSNAAEMERMMSFGAGSRTCIGKHVYQLVPQQLRNFDVRLVREKGWETRNFWFNKSVDVMVVYERDE
ncbi:cytochrome P450 [Aspergillus californicus]